MFAFMLRVDVGNFSATASFSPTPVSVPLRFRLGLALLLPLTRFPILLVDLLPPPFPFLCMGNALMGYALPSPMLLMVMMRRVE